jgi:ankyrin repeat protein
VAPLHRAVRTGCSAAVSAIIENGADPPLMNKSGSTPAPRRAEHGPERFWL